MINPVRLRELRLQLGLTQKELADRAGITAPYMSQLESGARGGHNKQSSVRTMQTAQRLAAALDVDVEELFNEGTMKRPRGPDPEIEIMRLLTLQPVAVQKRILSWLQDRSEENET